MFNLKSGEQRNIVFVQFHPADVLRHDVAHELPGLLINGLGVDQNFADFLVKVIADRPNDQAAFLIDQIGAALLIGGGLDCSPKLHQIAQVPVEFLNRTADTCGTGDYAHAGGHFELGNGVAQFIALFAFDATRYTAAARVIGHQNDIAPGEADECGQRRALGATLVLVDLDNQLLAFAQSLFDGNFGRICFRIAKKRAADFLERKKSMTFIAVVYECRFQTRFDAGDDTLVDIALALFFSGCFYIKVYQLLAIYNRDTQFFSLGRVKQHTLHYLLSRAHFSRGGQTWRRQCGAGLTGFPSSDNSWVVEDDSYVGPKVYR